MLKVQRVLLFFERIFRKLPRLVSEPKNFRAGYSEICIIALWSGSLDLLQAATDFLECIFYDFLIGFMRDLI